MNNNERQQIRERLRRACVALRTRGTTIARGERVNADDTLREFRDASNAHFAMWEQKINEREGK